MSTKRVLMCRPDYYGVRYEINPWMSVKNQPDRNLAEKQGVSLKEALENEGLWVSRIDQIDGLPDMVFTANAGIFSKSKNTILLSRFFHPERRGEIAWFRTWFLSRGINFETLPEGAIFEGEGDALVCGKYLVCGHGIRSNEAGARAAAEFMELTPLLLELKDPHFYHLDTCFCALGENLVMAYLPAFKNPEDLERLGEIIPTSRYDAEHFVCNGVAVGNKLITTPVSSFLRSELEKKDLVPVECDLSEFIKAGGAAKCLTLFI